MAHIVEIRGKSVVANDDSDDTYLPVGTHIDRPDGHYVRFGMDVEGPYSHPDAMDRLKSLETARERELGHAP